MTTTNRSAGGAASARRPFRARLGHRTRPVAVAARRPGPGRDVPGPTASSGSTTSRRRDRRPRSSGHDPLAGADALARSDSPGNTGGEPRSPRRPGCHGTDRRPALGNEGLHYLCHPEQDRRPCCRRSTRAAATLVGTMFAEPSDEMQRCSALPAIPMDLVTGPPAARRHRPADPARRRPGRERAGAPQGVDRGRRATSSAPGRPCSMNSEGTCVARGRIYRPRSSPILSKYETGS